MRYINILIPITLGTFILTRCLFFQTKLPQLTLNIPTFCETCRQTTTFSPSPPNLTPLPFFTNRSRSTSAARATTSATLDLTSATLTGRQPHASSLLSQTALQTSYQHYLLAENQMNSMMSCLPRAAITPFLMTHPIE